MNRQTYGIVSLLLIVAAVITATYAILQSSVIWTVIISGRDTAVVPCHFLLVLHEMSLAE